MRACYAVEFVTPKGIILRGLWFGPKRARQVVVWVHGLGSSTLAKMQIVEELVGNDTAVFAFYNRGHDIISRIIRGTRRLQGGAAHEVFTECRDDIQGAVRLVRRNGTKQIFIAGHSTGSQKAAYWAGRGGRGVRGVILLAPISDFAAELKRSGRRKLERGQDIARTMIVRGKKHSLLPERAWKEPIDAQRFLSLYTADSIEQSIFTYFDTKRSPRMLRKIRIPTLVLLAEKDEYGDRPAKKIAEWFAKHVQARKSLVRIVPKAPHSFNGGERIVAREMRKWMETL